MFWKFWGNTDFSIRALFGRFLGVFASRKTQKMAIFGLKNTLSGGMGPWWGQKVPESGNQNFSRISLHVSFHLKTKANFGTKLIRVFNKYSMLTSLVLVLILNKFKLDLFRKYFNVEFEK